MAARAAAAAVMAARPRIAAAAAATPWQLANPAGKWGHTYFYMIRHFLTVVYTEWYGKVMLTIWSGYFVWLAVWPKTKRKKSLKNKQKTAAAAAAAGEQQPAAEKEPTPKKKKPKKKV